MQVIINNQNTEVKASNVQALAEELALPQKGVAVAIANRMVPRTEWAATALHENDNIVVIKAACGG